MKTWYAVCALKMLKMNPLRLLQEVWKIPHLCFMPLVTPCCVQVASKNHLVFILNCFILNPFYHGVQNTEGNNYLRNVTS